MGDKMMLLQYKCCRTITVASQPARTNQHLRLTCRQVPATAGSTMSAVAVMSATPAASSRRQAMPGCCCRQKRLRRFSMLNALPRRPPQMLATISRGPWISHCKAAEAERADITHTCQQIHTHTNTGA